MNKDNLPYVFSVVFCVSVALSVAWNCPAPPTPRREVRAVDTMGKKIW